MTDQYFVKEEEFMQFMKNVSYAVQHLDLSHAYWLPQRAIQKCVSHCCKKLQVLSVVECKLKITQLVSLLSSCTALRHLAFSLSSFTDIKKEVFQGAQKTLKLLQKLHLYYNSREMTLMNYFGEHATLLDFCEQLEQLIISSSGMAIPELYLPLVTQPQKHKHLKVMQITNNIHAGAQMLFYSTLSQLPNSDIAWQTLLMPNVNLTEFIKKPEFRACLANLSSLRDLDVSGSKVAFPNDALDMTTATELRHLCISKTTVNSEQLKMVASNCNKLTSVNLFGCSCIFQGVGMASVDRVHSV